MTKTFERIKELVKRHEIKVSDHGYDEIAEDGIFIKDIITDIDDVREALREGALQSATNLARVFRLTPVSV